MKETYQTCSPALPREWYSWVRKGWQFQQKRSFKSRFSLYRIFLTHLHEIVFIQNAPTTSQVDSSFMNESRMSDVRHDVVNCRREYISVASRLIRIMRRNLMQEILRKLSIPHSLNERQIPLSLHKKYCTRRDIWHRFAFLQHVPKFMSGMKRWKDTTSVMTHSFQVLKQASSSTHYLRRTSRRSLAST